ncbi:hypothetical protein AQUSIP_00290 [Aquicella siphonis]|uniref:Pyridoxal phosphate homeostasis protein n=1 Tax=Aquicella siphonis TaxID=254247 RepID=A0A5E4PEA7_9COXI|nr:YggS family pyridoxal phosphate-dependent enzyme [Aquicella siphonis]VVC74757.1 hypothetical protein AQUSIP_00290 [Aquicella siphonis]
MTAISDNLAALLESIRAFEKKYGRDPGSVKLLAASKKQSVDSIKAAFDAGQCCFGESYLQEAAGKFSALHNLPIEWHFIGPVQSNKTRKIAEFFSWVHSVDSMRIVKRLNDQRPDHLPPLNICIEVNVSGEASKSGVLMDQVLGLALYCQNLPRIRLRGLMAIPAIHHRFDHQRQEFHKLQSLFLYLREHHFSVDTLSMGMSDDFEAAIAEGSTIVRIGTALFGRRV